MTLARDPQTGLLIRWGWVPIGPSWSLIRRLEVGIYLTCVPMSWAASQYSFRNLRFKHRGMQLCVYCSLTYLLAYPYAWTLNCGNCIGLQLMTHQPPSPEASQSAAWSHKYIGYWNGETEGSPIGFATIVWQFETWNFPWAKVIDFEPLGALFGLGAPEAVWSISHCRT